jgi:outer membrane autotransporter protein
MEVLGYRGRGARLWVSLSRHTTHEVRKNPLLGGLLPTFPLHQIARDRDATRRGADFRHRLVMSTKLPATEIGVANNMSRLLSGVSRIALAASVAALVAPAPALAANFTVSTTPPDPNSTTAKTVTNNDTGTVQSGAALTVTGTAITWTGGSASPGVTIDNSGTITGTTRAIDTSGAFTTGTISLINRAGASITGTGNDAFRINTNITNGTVSVNNSGTILSNGGQTLDFAAITSATASIQITNNATGIIRSTADDAIRPGSGTISITNSGLIESTAASARAINLNTSTLANLQSVQIINNAGATIQSAGDAVRITATSLPLTATGTFSLDNAGTIRSTGVGANNGQAIDFNDLVSPLATVTITNRATGLISAADADAIRAGNNSTVNNYGTIVANNGTPTSTGNDGIDFQGNSGTVNNFVGGSITGARHGITGTQPITVYNAGTITGLDGSGINLDTGPTTITSIENHGTIVGNLHTSDGDGIDVDGLVVINNYGKIQAVGVGSANLSEAITVGGGTINNFAGGLLISAQRAITVDDSNLGNAFAAVTIYNEGTIQGDNGEAIKITSTFANTLTNKGSIIGSVAMGNGSDTVNLYAGSSISGTLDGNGGTDTINLYGPGAGTISSAVNFEALNVQSGSWTLTGTQTYANGTTVFSGASLFSDGTLGGPVNVQTGGLLGGTGTVGDLTVAGTLSPGHSIGTLTVSGSLVFTTAATYLVEVSPATADRTNVSGTAALAGTVQAAFQPGNYLVNSYTILHSGGLGGTKFDSLTTGNLLPGFSASLSYTTTDVLLNLTAALGAGGGLGGNQQNVAGTINNFFNNGGALPPGFLGVFGLTGGNLNNALSLLSGETATGSQQGAFQLMTQFLALMLDPFVDGRSGVGGTGGGAIGLAPERAAMPEEIALAYASVLKAPVYKATPFEQRFNVWGSAYGGTNRTSGDPSVAGSHDLTARAGGFAAGLDYRVTPDTVIGFALAGGGTNWGLAQGLGNGKSDAFQAGLYGSTRWGPAYVAASLAYANHWMSTDRFAVAGDHLTASFNAQSVGGRLEGGYRMATAFGALTPYAALQAQSFWTPSYSETDVNGGGFGLAYNARTASDTRSEIGGRFDKQMALDGGAALALRARLAWAHDWVSDPTLTAVFQALPGASFLVNGAAPAKNSALASAGAELRLKDGISLLGKFDGEFARGSSTYAGTGMLRVSW